MSFARPTPPQTEPASDLRDTVAFAVVDQAKREVVSLMALAEALGDDELADVVCDLNAAANVALPYPNRLFYAASALAQKLEAVTFEDIARFEARASGITDLNAAILFYGARSHDIAARLSRII